MAFKIEHELHGRRQGRNLGVGVILLGLVAVIFGVTVVKVTQLGDAGAFETSVEAVPPQVTPPEPLTGGDQ